MPNTSCFLTVLRAVERRRPGLAEGRAVGPALMVGTAGCRTLEGVAGRGKGWQSHLVIDRGSQGCIGCMKAWKGLPSSVVGQVGSTEESSCVALEPSCAAFAVVASESVP